MNKKLYIWGVVILAIIAAFFSSVRLITDWQWFSSLGFLRMYVQPFVIQLIIYVITS